MNQQQKLTISANGKRSRDTLPSALSDAGRPAIDREFLAQTAIVCIAAILIVGALSLGRSFFMPVLAATIVGITLSPLQKWGARFGIPSSLIALSLVVVFFGIVWIVGVLVFGAVSNWIDRAPELEQVVKEKLSYLERPIDTIRDFIGRMGGATAGEGQKVSIETSLAEIARHTVAVLQPALTEFLVFFGTLLFFLAGINRLRRQLIVYFSTREGRLRVMRIWNEIEDNLIAYLGTVTAINLGVGMATALMLYLLGFSNPIALGALAFVLNYVPYIGPFICTLVLLAISIVTYPTIGGALLPPALFVGLNMIEGNFITPSVVGRRLTLSPFVVFVSLDVAMGSAGGLHGDAAADRRTGAAELPVPA
jgi:predicted PurR-regulated permease PerM